jgi:hypothetical protein
MKTALIVTLGNRDIQLDARIPANEFLNINPNDKNSACYKGKDENFGEVLFLKSAREHGKIIFENYEFFKPYLKYPIVKPAIEYIKKFTDLESPDLVIVYTDQPETEKNRKGDTLFYAEIIAKLVQDHFPNFFANIYYVKVSHAVTEYDTMYDFFTEEFKKTPLRNYDRNSRIFLLPQGGIDQINTALMLKCFEYFPQLVQLSKPEGKEIVPLKFNQRFYTAINKNKILYAINHFYYHLVNQEMTTNPLILLYARYAKARLELDFEELKKIWNELLREDREGWTIINLTLPCENDEFSKQREYYLALKVSLYQKNYSDFVIRLVSLYQNMLKKFIADKYNIPIPHTKDEAQEAWKKLLDQNPEVLEYLKNEKTNKGEPINYKEPSVFILEKVYNHFASGEEKRLIPLFKFMQKAVDVRNETAHQLKPVLQTDIEKLFDGKQNEIMNRFDSYFNVNGFDIYDKLNQKIRSLLE